MLVNSLRTRRHVNVKFCQMKDCEKVLKAKSDLENLNKTNLDLPEGSKIFIQERLCSYYRMLWSRSKQNP